MNNPKYQIGEKVWMIEYSTVKRLEITGIFNFKKGGYVKGGIRYSFLDEAKDHSWKEESDLFPTKEALIQSL